MSGECVKVAIRVRPLLGYETTIKSSKIVSYPQPSQISIAGSAIQHGGGNKENFNFTFDYVFDDYSHQYEVYDQAIQPLVKAHLEGYNATILAYGQTGSGKTHTMGTASETSMKEEDFGIIPRVIKAIFGTIKSREQTHVHVVKVSFLEIHNEDINDLLYNLDGTKSNQTKPIPAIRDGPNNSVIVTNTDELEVHSYDDMMGLLMKGSQNRVVAATQMNAHSSRSHAIFTIITSQKRIAKAADSSSLPASSNNTGGGTAVPEDTNLLEPVSDEVMTSRFNFVDLAGSERLKRTGAVGDRMKEGININQGLLALGNVISALSDEKRRAGHVPYRDSKITRMLQDSLGGNSRTLMIACVSPADVNAEESLNTLKYANRTKNIKNKALQNKDPNSAKFDALKQKILQLEAALAQFTSGNAAAGAALLSGNAPVAPVVNTFDNPDAISIDRNELNALREAKILAEAELTRLQQKLKDMKSEVSTVNDKLVALEVQRDTYRLKLEKSNPAAVAAIDSNNELKATDPSNPNYVLGGVEEKEISLLEENRRTVNKLHRKLMKQKNDLQTAMKLLESYSQGTHPSSVKGSDFSIKKVDVTNEDGEVIGQELVLTEECDDKSGEKKEINKVDEDDEAAAGDEEVHSSDIELSDSEDENENSESLKLLADLKEREFQHQMKQLNSEQHSLTNDIATKQQSMIELRMQSQQILAVRKEYEQKIETMEKEIADLASERETALKELESKSKEKDYQDKVNAIRDRYESKLKVLAEQLNKTKEKLKDNDKLKKQIKDDESKIKKLEVDINNAKKQKVLLTKQMELNTQKYKEFVDAKEAKMRIMQKEAHKASLEIKKMQVEYEKQAAVLKRRNEEKAMLEKQIKSHNEKKENAKKIRAGNFTKATDNNINNTHNRNNSNNMNGAIHPSIQDKTTEDDESLSVPAASSAVTSRKAAREKRKRHTPLKSRAAVTLKSPTVSGNLSDSSAPSHSSAAVDERAIQNTITDYISAAVKRSMLNKELEALIQKREQLTAESAATTEKMMEENIAPQLYTQLENSLVTLDNLVNSLQKQIDQKQRQIAAIPLPGQENINNNPTTTTGNTDLDYRALLSIKLPNLDASKKALVYLMQQAVSTQQSQLELESEAEFLRAEMEEERRRRLEAEKRRDELERKNLELKRTTRFKLSALNVHYELLPAEAHKWDNSSNPKHTRNTSNNYNSGDATEMANTLAAGNANNNNLLNQTSYTPIQNNFVNGDPNQNPDTQKSVFSRLTDAKQYTGMYKNIHETDKPVKQKHITEIKKPPMDTSNKPPNTTVSSTLAVKPPHGPQKSLSNNPLVFPALSTSASTDSLASNSYRGTTPQQQQQIVEGKNVFSRLTNPATFTGQHKFRQDKKAAPNPSATGPILPRQPSTANINPNNLSPNCSRSNSRRNSETAINLAALTNNISPNSNSTTTTSSNNISNNSISNDSVIDDPEYAAAEAAHLASKLHQNNIAAGIVPTFPSQHPTPRSKQTSASFSEGHTLRSIQHNPMQPQFESEESNYNRLSGNNNQNENDAFSPDHFSTVENPNDSRFSFNADELDLEEENHSQPQSHHNQDNGSNNEEEHEEPSFHIEIPVSKAGLLPPNNPSRSNSTDANHGNNITSNPSSARHPVAPVNVDNLHERSRERGNTGSSSNSVVNNGKSVSSPNEYKENSNNLAPSIPSSVVVKPRANSRSSNSRSERPKYTRIN